MPSILLVDDSKILRATLRHTFEEVPGWTICGEAVDGRDAVKQAQQCSPDVILLDFSMPVMNGLDAARELKRLLPSAILVMFTTYKIEGLEKEATAAGCKAVRYKFEPVHLLLDTIRVLLGATSHVLDA